MDLKTYLTTKPDAHWAGMFGVTERRIRSWRYGQRLPRPDLALEMVKATGGELTLADIYRQANKQDAA